MSFVKTEGVEIPTTRFVKKLTLLACLSSFLFGYDTGIISGVLLLIKKPEIFDLSDTQQEFVVSSTVAAAILGSLVGGKLNETFGRKPVILCSAVIFIMGSVVMGLAPDYYILLIGRSLVGIGVGISSMTVPVYISEAAPASARGVLLLYVSMCITGGQFLSCVIAGSLSYTSNGWRAMLWLGAIPGAIQFFGFLSLPESPRWLALQGREQEALVVLRRIRAEDSDEGISNSATSTGLDQNNRLEAEISCELRSIQDSLSERAPHALREDNRSHSFFRIFCVPSTRRALMLGCVLQLGQQLAGINTAMYYGATIITMAGFTDERQAIWMSSLFGFANFIGTFIGLHLVDRVGRRLLMLRSLASVILLLILIGGGFYLAEVLSTGVRPLPAETGVSSYCPYSSCFDCVQASSCGFCAVSSAESSVPIANFCAPTDSKTNSSGESSSAACDAIGGRFYSDTCPCDSTAPGSAIVAFVALYLILFAPGVGSMPWTVTSEIFPLDVRSQCVSISTSLNWIGNLGMSLSFLTITSAISRAGAFWLYSGLSCITFAYLYFNLPETKGLSLEQITRYFEEQPSGCNGYSALDDGELSNKRDSAIS